jgi:hypothetical protein
LKHPQKIKETNDQKSKDLILSLGLKLEDVIIYIHGRTYIPKNSRPYGKLILMPGKGPITWCLMKQYLI